VARDVQYGPAERNLADIFVPENPGATPRAVLLFVHGGGFTRGDRKSPAGSPFYDNIAVWAARNGFIGVNMTYRLAPKFMWPAAVQDVVSAVRYLESNIEARGGNPARIFLMGQSAGAVHVASYIAHPEFHGSRGAGVAGAIIASGAYDFIAFQLGDPEQAYLGTDPDRYQERSSIRGLVETEVPLLIANAEFDPPMFVQQAKQLRDALREAGKKTVILTLAGHNHLFTVSSINTDDKSFSGQIASFIGVGSQTPQTKWDFAGIR
jgi:acetyl esterase/lipase